MLVCLVCSCLIAHFCLMALEDVGLRQPVKHCVAWFMTFVVVIWCCAPLSFDGWETTYLGLFLQGLLPHLYSRNNLFSNFEHWACEPTRDWYTLCMPRLILMFVCRFWNLLALLCQILSVLLDMFGWACVVMYRVRWIIPFVSSALF